MKDLYGREITYLRLSVTESCNLRCRYCIPEDCTRKKLHGGLMTEDEIIRSVEAAASLGIRKVRITGGEPLVRPDILSICRRVSGTEGIKEVSMTTNALLLADQANALYDAGIRRLNISLDTLDPEKYTWITRGGTLRKAIAGIEESLKVKFERIKLNTVLIGGFNENEIPALADLTRRWPVDVRFIELMPMPGSSEFGKEAYISCARVTEMLPELVRDREGSFSESGGVAKLYSFPGAPGKVGLISPVNEPFCEACCRLRLTADGKIRPCLYSDLEFPVRGLDRVRMEEQFKAAIHAKPRWHGGLTLPGRCLSDRCMNQIGG